MPTLATGQPKRIDSATKKNLYHSPWAIPVYMTAFQTLASHPHDPESIAYLPFLIKWQSKLFYLDRILLLSETIKNNHSHLQRVFTLLPNAGVMFKLKHYSFFSLFIDYYCYFIRPGRSNTTKTIFGAIKKLQCLSTKANLRSFRGLYNVHSFI